MSEDKKTLQQKLSDIQRNLNVPKKRLNPQFRHKFRNCEDILEAVKPFLDGCFININDEIVLIGKRYYVKSMAIFTDGVSARIESTAFAREPKIKKGTDESQITGAASSYARKYALNGLFAIDDAHDADSMDNRKPEKDLASQSKLHSLALGVRHSTNEEELSKSFKEFYRYSFPFIKDDETVKSLYEDIVKVKDEMKEKFKSDMEVKDES